MWARRLTKTGKGTSASGGLIGRCIRIVSSLVFQKFLLYAVKIIFSIYEDSKISTGMYFRKDLILKKRGVKTINIIGNRK